MNCSKCNEVGEHKIFSTFDYWFCISCRIEITIPLNKTDFNINWIYVKSCNSGWYKIRDCDAVGGVIEYLPTGWSYV